MLLIILFLVWFTYSIALFALGLDDSMEHQRKRRYAKFFVIALILLAVISQIAYYSGALDSSIQYVETFAYATER